MSENGEYFETSGAEELSYVVGSKSFRRDQIFKVTNKTTTSTSASSILEHVVAWNWHINLTTAGAIYP
jgi:hypothetical protein